ncbi:MAG: hypothetical protein RQ966_18075 [Acetobacteraceae bacterium]|nr:hypothetical protein [Acetobacteraceae bacterium]
MDRQIVYPGSIPLDTDFLSVQRNTLSALGALSQSVLGSSPVADGLACSPAPSGYGVVIGSGTLSMSVALDRTTFGSLPGDSTAVVKTGAIVAPVTIPLETTADQAMVLSWLIQATLTEVDDQPLTLQYWNASAPAIPYSGPNNSGSAQNTRRRTQLIITAKSSAPIPFGTLAAPNPDPGFVGLYGVTTWVGKPSTTADDIHVLPTAPFLRYHLPDLTPGFSRLQVFSSNTTWAVPSGVSRVRVRLVGAGGGGGGGTANFGGGGGGGGGYAEAILQLQPGQNIAVVVGVGGASSPANVTGGAGGASSFGNLVVAQGGFGGASANPDSHGGTGGLGTVGTLVYPGGMGGDGPMIGNVPAGSGGATVFGGGGRGSMGGGTSADGRAPGSGAGGGYGANSAGGFGAAGLVLVEY